MVAKRMIGIYEGGYLEPFKPDSNSAAIPVISFVDDTLRDWAPQVDSRPQAPKRFIQRTGI